ncbi:MAG: type II RES/Xre toxin-antitoxin system antitoxin [Gammaproteobacteria bacterium]
MAERSESVMEVLGGIRAIRRSKRRNGDDLRLVVRDGLPAKTVDAVMDAYGVSQETVVKLLGVSESTLRRRRESGRLTSVESDRLYRLASAGASAEKALGSRERAVNWLHSPNRALEGETPLSMLDTDIGYQRIRDILGRLEHGVYS